MSMNCYTPPRTNSNWSLNQLIPRKKKKVSTVNEYGEIVEQLIQVKC